VNLAATYAIRPSLQPFATLTGDYRDFDISAGWRWLAVEAAYGNGFLDTLEHRQQYKVNALKGWNLGAPLSDHAVSRLLRKVDGSWSGADRRANLHDTIDPRQRDQTQPARSL